MDRKTVLGPVLKFIGKSSLEIDEDIPASYVVRTCLEQGIALVRGVLTGIGFAEKTGFCLLGSRVRLRCRSRIFLGSRVRMQSGVYIDALSSNGVRIGDRSLLGRDTRIECTGSLAHIGKGLSIGADSTFGAGCYFGAAGGIQIGDEVMAGQYVRFHAENHITDDLDVPIRSQGVTHKGITVGNNVWIGAGVVFLDGAVVGDGCVIAADAVVTGKEWPPNSVIGGVPARVIKSRGKK